MFQCEHCGERHSSMWAAAYCCDPWPAEVDERDIRRGKTLRFPHP